jgi:sec-independent protein translocase protein TatA
VLPLHYPVVKGQFEFLNGFEWVIILLVILLIFGPSKLPQLARGLGQAIHEFRKASQGLIDEGESRKEKREEASRELDEETLRKLAEKLGIENADKMDKEELAKNVLVKAKEKGLIKEEIAAKK